MRKMNETAVDMAVATGRVGCFRGGNEIERRLMALYPGCNRGLDGELGMVAESQGNGGKLSAARANFGGYYETGLNGGMAEVNFSGYAGGMERSGRDRGLILGLFLVGMSPQFFNGWYLPWLSHHLTLFWVVDVLAMAVLPVGIFFGGRRLGLWDCREVGFRMPRGTVAIVLSVVGLFLLPLLYHQGTLLFRKLWIDFWDQPGTVSFTWSMILSQGKMPLTKILAGVFLAVTAGFVEEFYYRGVLRLLFGNSLPQLAAYVIISSLLFGVVHWEQGISMIFSTFVLGVCAALFYLKAGSIWPLALGHTLADIIFFT